MKISKKTGIIALVLVIALSIASFGFAAWTSTITLSGTAELDGSWDIAVTKIVVTATDFADIANLNGSTDVTGSGSATETGFTDAADVSLGAVTLRADDAAVKYTIEITNNGTVDAKLAASPTLLDDVYGDANGDNIAVTGNYPDGGEVLAAGESCTLSFVLKAVDGDADGTLALDAEELSISLEYNPDGAIVALTADSHKHA